VRPTVTLVRRERGSQDVVHLRRFEDERAQIGAAVDSAALSKVVPVSQIVFGTDYPYRTPAEHVKRLKDCGVFSARDLQMIDRENALPLFPRFKA